MDTSSGFAGSSRYRRILNVLLVGFAAVILLLATALGIAFLRSRQIQMGSAQQVRSHLATASLVDLLQLQRQRINTLLFRAARYPHTNPKAFLDEIADIELQVHRIAASGRGAGLAAEWDEVDQVITDLHRLAVMNFSQPPLEEEELDKLSNKFERFVTLTAAIVRADSERSIQLDQRIQAASFSMLRDFFLLTAVCILIAAACAYLTIRTTNESVRQMEWQAQELNRVSWQMLESQEQTARRFSHEMHDELGQSLTGLKAYLSAMKPDEFDARRDECIHVLEDAIGNVREMSQLLRPVILDDFGLDAALRWLCERFTARTRIQVDYESNAAERPREEVETHFFRIAQEALTNVARHSGATRVRLKFDLSGGHFRLIVADNGRGMEMPAKAMPAKAMPAKAGCGLGMVGMRARARQVDGEFKARPADGGGLHIEAWAPMTKPA